MTARAIPRPVVWLLRYNRNYYILLVCIPVLNVQCFGNLHLILYFHFQTSKPNQEEKQQTSQPHKNPKRQPTKPPNPKQNLHKKTHNNKQNSNPKIYIFKSFPKGQQQQQKQQNTFNTNIFA